MSGSSSKAGDSSTQTQASGADYFLKGTIGWWAVSDSVCHGGM